MDATPNMGSLDRVIRAAVGIALLLVALSGLASGLGGLIVGAVGVIMLVTAALRFCPAYRILGIKTCKT